MKGERAPLIHFVAEVIISSALYLPFAALHLPVAVLSHALMVFFISHHHIISEKSQQYLWGVLAFST